MTYLTYETGVKTRRIKVDDNGEKKEEEKPASTEFSETMRKTDSSQSFLEGLDINVAQFTASFYTVIAAKFSVSHFLLENCDHWKKFAVVIDLKVEV